MTITETCERAERLLEDFNYYRDAASRPGLQRNAADLFPDLVKALQDSATEVLRLAKLVNLAKVEIRNAPHDALNLAQP